jgi:hypothetical protein
VPRRYDSRDFWRSERPGTGLAFSGEELGEYGLDGGRRTAPPDEGAKSPVDVDAPPLPGGRCRLTDLPPRSRDRS